MSSEIKYVGINNEQNNFEKAVEIMKNKVPDFHENWKKRRELSDDEEKGILLYQKYQK